jgi:hypothetical protein
MENNLKPKKKFTTLQILGFIVMVVTILVSLTALFQ